MNGTMADFARHIGVNKSSVCRAAKAGRVVFDAAGRVDFDASVARWHQTAGGRTDVAERHAKARHAAGRGAAIPKAAPGADRPTAAHGSPTAPDLGITLADDGGRAKAKALGMHYENSAIKLEMALRRGLRLELAAARREGGGLGALLRAGIERVIDQTAPRLAAAADELARRRLIEAELARLRWMVKRELPRALRRIRDASAGPAKVGAGGTAKEGA